MQKKKLLIYGLILFIGGILAITIWLKVTTPPIVELGQLPTPDFITVNYPNQRVLISQILQENQTTLATLPNLPVYQVDVKTLNVDLLVKTLQLSSKSITQSVNIYTNDQITLSYFKNKEFITIIPQKDNLQYQIGIIKEKNEPLQACQALVESYDYYQDISLEYNVQDQAGTFVVTGYQTYDGNKLGLTAERPMLIECNIGPEGQIYNITLLNHYFAIQSQGSYPSVSLPSALSNSINSVWPHALDIKTIITGEGMGANLLAQTPTNIQILSKKNLHLLGCGEGENDCYMYPVWYFSLDSKIGRNTVFFKMFFLKLNAQYWGI